MAQRAAAAVADVSGAQPLGHAAVACARGCPPARPCRSTQSPWHAAFHGRCLRAVLWRRECGAAWQGRPWWQRIDAARRVTRHCITVITVWSDHVASGRERGPAAEHEARPLDDAAGAVSPVHCVVCGGLRVELLLVVPSGRMLQQRAAVLKSLHLLMSLCALIQGSVFTTYLL